MSECQLQDPVKLEMEVISLKQRAFIIDNFVSNADADAIIKQATPMISSSHVGDLDIGVQDSGTRTSKKGFSPQRNMQKT